jgi:DNA-binding GntR family transcriptional regulator
MAARPRPRPRAERNLAHSVYCRLKAEIFDFRWLPGDRFSENEIAARMKVSRTPVREALLRLAREDCIEVIFRSGWRVKPFDFRQFEDLYDLRVILETAAVRRLCEMAEVPALEPLKAAWLVPVAERLTDAREVAALDEAFHEALVAATGNAVMSRVHHEITEKIRIIRRLDFTQAPRIEATYLEHGKILRAILQRRSDPAQMLLRSHVEGSKAEVRRITLHMLHAARERSAA